MQGNQKKWRWTMATGSGLTSLLAFWVMSAAISSAEVMKPVETKTSLLAQTVTPTEVAPPSANSPNLTQQRETEAALGRATTLFAVMLGALVLLLGIGIFMLWALRKSAIREVVSIMSAQSNELTALENKVHNATRSLNRVLADADELSGELQGRSSNFQREIGAQREVLHNLIEELDAFKLQAAKDWEKQLDDLNSKLEMTAGEFAQTTADIQAQAKQRLEEMQTDTAVESQRILQRFTTSEAEFSRHVGVIKEETQRRKTAFFDEIDRKESVLSDQMGSLQAETVAEKDRVLSGIAKQGSEFGPKLSEAEAAAKAKIEQQRDQTLESLKRSEEAVVSELEEVQASALGHRELALQNIQRASEELQQQFSAIRSEGRES